MRRLLFSGLALLIALGFSALPARALPVFAHRYGFSCQRCHTTVPTLNQFGIYFQRHGFRLPSGARRTFPVAVKVQLAYSSADGAGLPKAIVDEVELLSAGALGPNAHYYLEQYAVDGGRPGRPRDMWIQLDRPMHADDPLGTTLHLRAGEFTLPLPLDPETQRPTLAHYAAFDQQVGSNPFTFFDTRVGADLSLTNERTGLESHLVLSRPDVMGTLSKTIGSDLTAYLYRYQGRRALGPTADAFSRQGYGLGYQRARLQLTGIVQHGFDTSEDGLGSGAASSGGFAQVSWVFNPALQFLARYDATFDDVSGRANGLTGTLVMRPARNVRFTLEGTRAAGATQLGLGLMFAY